MSESQADLAKAIAHIAHRGQVDKGGRPYIEHPAAVAALVRSATDSSDAAVAAAWLHDVLEDTDVTEQDLRAAGIEQGVIRVVQTLTRRDDEPVEVYYSRIRNYSVTARCVKRADIRHNTDPRRLVRLEPEVQLRLLKKYAKALDHLEAGF